MQPPVRRPACGLAHIRRDPAKTPWVCYGAGATHDPTRPGCQRFLAGQGTGFPLHIRIWDYLQATGLVLVIIVWGFVALLVLARGME